MHENLLVNPNSKCHLLHHHQFTYSIFHSYKFNISPQTFFFQLHKCFLIGTNLQLQICSRQNAHRLQWEQIFQNSPLTTKVISDTGYFLSRNNSNTSQESLDSLQPALATAWAAWCQFRIFFTDGFAENTVPPTGWKDEMPVLQIYPA